MWGQRQDRPDPCRFRDQSPCSQGAWSRAHRWVRQRPTTLTRTCAKDHCGLCRHAPTRTKIYDYTSKIEFLKVPVDLWLRHSWHRERLQAFEWRQRVPLARDSMQPKSRWAERPSFRGNRPGRPLYALEEAFWNWPFERLLGQMRQSSSEDRHARLATFGIVAPVPKNEYDFKIRTILKFLIRKFEL